MTPCAHQINTEMITETHPSLSLDLNLIKNPNAESNNGHYTVAWVWPKNDWKSQYWYYSTHFYIINMLAANHFFYFIHSFIQVRSRLSQIPSNDKWRLLILVVMLLLTLTTVPQVFRLKWRLMWVPLETPRHEEFDKKSSRPPTRSLGTDTSMELGSQCTGTGQDTGNIHTILTSVFHLLYWIDFQVKAVKPCGNLCLWFPGLIVAP